MRPTLRQMQYVLAVADTGKFGEAARKLNVSQPSLSAQIGEVEQLMGVRLLERGRRGALLTQKGEEFVQRARLILRHVEDLNAAMQHDAGELSGRIRLGTIPTIGPYLLPQAVQKLHANYPSLRLAVRDEVTALLDAGLRDGRLDTIISTGPDHQGCEITPLFTEHMWICVSDDDPLAGVQEPVRLNQLKGRTLLTLGPRQRLSIIVQALADKAQARVDTEYEGTSLDALRQMAATGTGVAILPSLYALCEARRDASLTLRSIAGQEWQRQISLIWRRQSPLAAGFARLADVLKTTADDLLSVEQARFS